ncbi:MAG: RHS repeat domain-containing protein, partial [Myxococcota bacterium]
ALTDENGNISWYADYEPFGKVNIMIEKTKNNFRFPGQYYITETGLYYNWWRWYKSEIGRYVQFDPEINVDKISRPNSSLRRIQEQYLYCDNKPLIKSDFSGQLSYTFIICCGCYGVICLCTETRNGNITQVIIVYFPNRRCIFLCCYDCSDFYPKNRCKMSNWA